MGIPFYDYQIDAVNSLRTGSILCGGVGSGKSRTAIGYYYTKECHGKFPVNDHNEVEKMKDPKDLYIITTAKKRDTGDWEAECSKFAISTDRARSYSPVQVKVDSWNNISKYCNVCGAFFIFDEQRLVGSGAWVKSFYQIAKKNDWILLSATPGDKWEDYIPVFVANGFYKNRTQFIKEHIIYNRFCKYPKVDKYLNVQKLIKLKKRILVHMDQNVREIERKTEVVKVTYNKALYARIHDDNWNIYNNQPIVNKSEWCMALRKLTNSDQSRVDATKKVIAQNDKLIIFYNFNYELQMLRDLCEELEVPYAEWNGHKHMDIPRTVNWVYLVQYTAGAEGWECITTDTILFFSLNYSYKIFEQARGRIDRVNTPYKYLYYIYLYADSGIDKAIMTCLNNKKDFNENEFA